MNLDLVFSTVAQNIVPSVTQFSNFPFASQFLLYFGKPPNILIILSIIKFRKTLGGTETGLNLTASLLLHIQNGIHLEIALFRENTL